MDRGWPTVRAGRRGVKAGVLARWRARGTWNDRRAAARRSLRSVGEELALDRVPHVAEDRADRVAQVDEGDDRDDGDEREDQRVLREALSLLVTMHRGEQ